MANRTRLCSRSREIPFSLSPLSLCAEKSFNTKTFVNLNELVLMKPKFLSAIVQRKENEEERERGGEGVIRRYDREK